MPENENKFEESLEVKCESEQNSVIDAPNPKENSAEMSIDAENVDIATMSEEPQKKQKSRFAAELFDYFEVFIVSACIVLMIFSCFFRICRVDGQSMEDTLHHDETLLVSKLFYTPAYGDIVVFHQTSDIYERYNKPIVKRVIAVAGDRVSIMYVNGKMQLRVNGELIDEGEYAAFKDELNQVWQYDSSEITVPEGHVFVLGDNRNHSMDSRYTIIGPVDERRILGRVIVRLTPFDKFGVIAN